MLPCFQLLRIGGGKGGDLYTFHAPNGTGCTYRLGCRVDLCDVALLPQREPGAISGIHAELHAERRGDDWKVSLEDLSSQGEQNNLVFGQLQFWDWKKVFFTGPLSAYWKIIIQTFAFP